MSVTLESLSALNPNPSYVSFPSKMSTLVPSLRFDPLLRPRFCRFSVMPKAVSPKLLGARFLSLEQRNSWKPPVLTYAASHEESNNIDIEVQKDKEDIKLDAEGSQEAWEQVLDSFKEQALKMQSISQEAYEVYSKKAVIILKETSEQLKIQAEKAKHDLSVVAKEISEEGKVYLTSAAENSPEPVKEIVETYTSSTDDLNEISRVHDFHVGIPYGLILSLGGFLSFMLTGSIGAIRFGVILGGTLLSLSILSLKSYGKGEPFPLALKGQAAIASIISLREILMLSQAPSFLSYFTTFISGAVVAFYVYRILLNRKRKRGSNLENQTEN
ncbi:protein FATTY ACID EXPORT 3, chloroplastic [Juglans regia]|uniref:Protein FATTY ACID EXPORT 3, chloroplastic n=2 Tax=Juglans regia TaxID=51240 RepID=A0A2I4E4Q4_JUGRE|nr:protein FATTY ACID EXPORT 3, chloroplastic [Juglans regia]